MNWAQFKDPVSHMWLPDTVVAYSWSRSFKQEVAGLSHYIFVTESSKFSETFRKTPLTYVRFLTKARFFVITKLDSG